MGQLAVQPRRITCQSSRRSAPSRTLRWQGARRSGPRLVADVRRTEPMQTVRNKPSNRVSPLSPWDGPVMLFFLSVIDFIILFEPVGTPTYLKTQFKLFVLLTASAVLLFLYVRYVPNLAARSVRDSAAVKAYWLSGRLGFDIYFVCAALSALFLLDYSFWRDNRIRVGTVVLLAILRLLVGSTWPRKVKLGV